MSIRRGLNILFNLYFPVNRPWWQKWVNTHRFGSVSFARRVCLHQGCSARAKAELLVTWPQAPGLAEVVGRCALLHK